MAVVVYLDTWVLREVVSKSPLIRRKSAQRFARLGSGVYTVKVPQTVIGEAVATVMRDFDHGEREELVGRIMQAVTSVVDPATCIPPPGRATVELAMQMMAHVRRLAMTDAHVTAQALSDTESQKIVTKDSRLTAAAWLKAEEQRMREDGKRQKRLKIDDKLWALMRRMRGCGRAPGDRVALPIRASAGPRSNRPHPAGPSPDVAAAAAPFRPGPPPAPPAARHGSARAPLGRPAARRPPRDCRRTCTQSPRRSRPRALCPRP